MPKVPTKHSYLSSAELCRANGWVPGTKLKTAWLEGNWLDWLVGEPQRRETTIRITAIGEKGVLAVQADGMERVVHLQRRDWLEVPC